MVRQSTIARIASGTLTKSVAASTQVRLEFLVQLEDMLSIVQEALDDSPAHSFSFLCPAGDFADTVPLLLD